MPFLAPLALLLGLLAVPIILMYMLRLRRRQVTVSSTLLWQKLLRDREANAPWQRLRRNLLLLLQLLILAALVFALARPFLPTPSLIRGNTVLLLDASASMQATDGSPTRFAAAQAEAINLVDDLRGRDQMTIIQAGRRPAVLASASSDRNELRRVINAAVPEAGTADWAAALALAGGAAQGYQDARIIIVSDGGLPSNLPPLPAETIYLPIGASGENLAITALATRDTPIGPQLFAAVDNEGVIDRTPLLSIELDGVLFDARRLTVPAGESASVTWDIPTATAVARATLSDNSDDILPLDDQAWAVHGGQAKDRVLLVTAGNLFLEQVFSVLPGLQTFKVNPANELPSEEFDLLIFDSTPLPDPLPTADMLIINPPPSSNNFLSVGNPFTNTVATRLADSSLLSFVEWRNVHIREARAVAAPWAQTIIGAEEGPLLLAGETNGQRLAILPFDLRDSDLPLQIAFPILMANIVQWLSPGQVLDTQNGFQPGDLVFLSPGAGTTAVTISKPDGDLWRTAVGAEKAIFTEAGLPGLYQITLEDPDGTRPDGSFAVNLFDRNESAVRPAAALQIGSSIVDTKAREGDLGRRELWPWLLIIAFIILLIEWWIYHRGTRLPRIRMNE